MNLKTNLSEFKKLIKNNLPGEIAHKKLSPKGRLLTSELLKNTEKNRESFKESAVSILIYQVEKINELILIQRQIYEGNHSGQISFPGGKKEINDENLFETATRECKEEIGFEPKSTHFIGNLSPVYIPISQFYVVPFVFFLDEKPNLIADNYEVQEIITIKLKDLLNENNFQVKTIEIKEKTIEAPCFYIDEKIIWGATAFMLNELKMIFEKI